MGESLGALGDATDVELEQALTALGRHVAYPPTPDIASRVRAATEIDPSPLVSARRDFPVAPFAAGASRLALAAACLLVALVVSLAIVPGMGAAIADRLGLRGVDIQWFDEAPAPEPTPIGAPLMLGRPVTLEEAREAVDFPVFVPDTPGFESPSEIYLSGEGQGAMISFVYPARPDLPVSDETGIGALLTQFRGNTGRGLIEKGLQAPGDGSEPATRLDPVSVRGEPGFWISGAPHAVFFVCFDIGECREERYRLAGDVLLWEQDGVTLRLESALPRDEALAVAESAAEPD